jgi:hypothetical protein
MQLVSEFEGREGKQLQDWDCDEVSIVLKSERGREETDRRRRRREYI